MASENAEGVMESSSRGVENVEEVVQSRSGEAVEKEIDNQYQVEVVELHRLRTVSIRKVIPVAEIGDCYKSTIERILSWAAETHNLPKPETTYGRYHKYDKKVFDIEIGMVVPEGITGTGDIKTSSLPAGKAAMVWHHGSMDSVEKAYDALDKWMRQEGRLPAGGPFEYHYVEKFETEDPSQFKTQIFFPILTFLPRPLVKLFRRVA